MLRLTPSDCIPETSFCIHCAAVMWSQNISALDSILRVSSLMHNMVGTNCVITVTKVEKIWQRRTSPLQKEESCGLAWLLTVSASPLHIPYVNHIPASKFPVMTAVPLCWSGYFVVSMCCSLYSSEHVE